MPSRKVSLWLAVATALLVPAKAQAQARARGAAASGRAGPVQRQGRRRGERAPQMMRPIASPCGRHVAEVIGGAVFVDGRRVRASAGASYVLAPPIWRRDGLAVAWIERSGGQARLVVVPGVDDGSPPLPWLLPAASADDRIFWTGARRVVVGPAVLAPHAVATWTD